jgi:cytoskeletal protein RodZ
VVEEKGSPAGEVGSFGQELRRERMARDVSLEEISKATKIGVRFLTALENDEFSILPAPVFTKGFIRSVARHLGLDPEKMVSAYVYHRQMKESDPGAVPTRRVRELPSAAETASRAEAGKLLARVLLFLLLTGAIIGIGFAVRRGFRSVGKGPESGPGLAATAAASWTAPSPPPSSSATPPQSPEVVLRLEFLAATWIDLSIDGRAQISETYVAGTTREFRAEEGFSLTVGNAAGIRGQVNGVALPPLGRSGQVVRGIRIDREGIRIPPPPPPAAASSAAEPDGN